MIPSRWALLTLLAIALPWGSGCDSPPQNKAREITFDDIKFDMGLTEKFQRSMITPNIDALFGRRVRIRGYIYPTLKKQGLTRFTLVRDNLQCCFGPGAALYDCILVHMDAGKSAEYSIRPVAVEGELRFEEFVDLDGTIRAIYHLDGEAVN